MKNLTEFLSRIRNAVDKDSIIKNKIYEIVLDKTRVKLDPEKIFIKNDVLEVVAGNTAKAEIKLKEEEILSSLNRDKVFIRRIFYK